MRSRRQRRLPFRPIVQPGRLVRASFTGTQPQAIDGLAVRLRFTGDSKVLKERAAEVRAVRASMTGDAGGGD